MRGGLRWDATTKQLLTVRWLAPNCLLGRSEDLVRPSFRAQGIGFEGNSVHRVPKKTWSGYIQPFQSLRRFRSFRDGHSTYGEYGLISINSRFRASAISQISKFTLYSYIHLVPGLIASYRTLLIMNKLFLTHTITTMLVARVSEPAIESIPIAQLMVYSLSICFTCTLQSKGRRNGDRSKWEMVNKKQVCRG
ncbi:hypothetical protein BJV74DRAFT_48562 [Russula compacta]|nr:hypothetical protein BJV74DRAFT_48562 [Russula compacta]